MFNKNSKRKNESVSGERPVLFRVIPPKSGEFSARGFINALEVLNLVDEVLWLELATDDRQVRIYVRSTRPDHVLSTLRSHYAQARFATVALEDDPLLMAGDEGAVCRQILWPAGEQWLTFQVQDDTGEDGNPLLSVVLLSMVPVTCPTKEARLHSPVTPGSCSSSLLWSRCCLHIVGAVHSNTLDQIDGMLLMLSRVGLSLRNSGRRRACRGIPHSGGLIAYQARHLSSILHRFAQIHAGFFHVSISHGELRQ